jgi:N-acetylglucosamine-6-phosphate deacetylase
LCEGERVLAVGGASAFNKEMGLKVVEMKGVYAVPGFIDTHIHGAGRFDSSLAADPDQNIKTMCDTLVSHGITSFLPTIVSNTPEKMMATVEALAKTMEDGKCPCEPVGIHVEGPFLNSEKQGAQQESYLREVDLGEAREMITAARNRIKIMTFAPELKNAVPLVETLMEHDIIPSMGHSLANEKEFLRAVDAGASRCTHLFNGMPPLHQREVGLTAMSLVDNRISVELILDEKLIHPRMIELACRAKPKDKIIGISDAVEGAGLSDGEYHLGECEIEVRQGKVTTKEGTIAGTIQTLEKGWRHLAEASHMPMTKAAACLTVNPAKSVGLPHRGEIRPGYIADIAFFNSNDHKPRMTVSRGKVVFDAPTTSPSGESKPHPGKQKK